MASPTPKYPEHRRRRAEPSRGEWITLEPLEKPVLAPAEDHWTPRVVRLWNAWRSDPVTAQYSDADIAAVRDLAERFEDLAPNEQRLRMDGLGLSPKGKRDLRWRTSAEARAAREQAPVRRLHAIGGKRPPDNDPRPAG